MSIKSLGQFIFLCLLMACQKDGNDTSTSTSADVDATDSDDSETGEPESNGPTIWSGPTLTFTKVDDADHTVPAHQDAITDNVVLTRGNRGSLFNVISETTANTQSPMGTDRTSTNATGHASVNRCRRR